MKYNRFSKPYWVLTSALLFSLSAAMAESVSTPALELPVTLGDAAGKLYVIDSEGEQAQRLVITDSTGNNFVDTTQALPKIKNAYSPYSYNGYIVDSFAENNGRVSVVDIQGETYNIIYPAMKAGSYVSLRTKEEDNSVYNYNLKFRFEPNAKTFALSHIFLNVNNHRCDQSLLSTYLIDDTRLGAATLNDFDGARAFDKLRALYIANQQQDAVPEKLMSEMTANNFDLALKAFRNGDTAELSLLISYFIAEGRDEACEPEEYIVEKFYYPRKVSWSNDLGFLFEQSGYYAEAAELLKHITKKHPERTVAYLNLADAYWAMDNKELARNAYGHYHEKMISAGREGKIPPRVLSRM